jgi:hypothetical protein
MAVEGGITTVLAFCSFSIWRTLGEAAMLSSPMARYRALAVLARVIVPARAAANRI